MRILQRELALRDLVGGALGQGVLVLAATTAAGGLNYLYHVVMGPLLGPESYGEFAALLGLLTVISIPASVVQMVVTQRLARLRALDRTPELSLALSSVIVPLLAFSLLMSLGLLLFKGPIAHFLRLPSEVPVLLLAPVALVSLLAPLTLGALNGLQRFRALSAALLSSPLLRFLSGIVLVMLGAGASGALAGSGVAALGVLVLGVLLVPAFFRLPRGRAKVEPSSFPVDILIAVLAFNALVNSDVAVVKHFFTASIAGQYAAAATLGKAILFLPGALSLLLLPKVTHRHAQGEPTTGILRLTISAQGALCAPLLGLYLLAPALVVKMVYGTAFLPSAAYLGLYGLTMVGYSGVSLLLWYYVAVGNRRFPLLLLMATGLQALGFLLFHKDPQQILAVLATVSLLLLVAGELICGGLRGVRATRGSVPERAYSA